MTEKRFIETISTGIVMDTQTGKEYNCEMRIDDDFLNLVNIIAEENEQLKSALRELKEIGDYQYSRINELSDENEQLKQYKKAIWDCNSSKIIRVNKNTGKVDLVDKELK